MIQDVMDKALDSLVDEKAPDYLVDLSESVVEIPAIIRCYFASFNAEDFDTTASLFAEDGLLRPPFDAVIEGRKEIAAYLRQEAKGMQIYPLKATLVDRTIDRCEYTVVGNAETPWFRINLTWQFIVNSNYEIVWTRVKLLASLQELLHLQHVQQQSAAA
jgi:hypothetical protein